MPTVLDAAFRLFARRLLRLADDPDKLFVSLARQEPVLTRLLRDSLLNAYLKGAKGIARTVLPRAAPWDLPGDGPPVAPPHLDLPGSYDSPVRFPAVEAAAEWLRRRRLLTPAEFATLESQSQSAAFTVARAATINAVERVRDAVGEAVRGGGLADFRKAIAGSKLSESQVETLFRTNEGHARSAGQRAVLDHELVRDEFPYRLWSATHDERTRPEHRRMETWGQDGTAVYRSDDPMWDTLYPPAGYRCRCAAIPLTLEDAARHGSHEARRWLYTGQRPVAPVYAATPYPITLPDGWPPTRGVVAVV